MDRGIDRRLVARYAVRETMGLVVMAVALFWPAGRWDWWAGWAALAVMAGWIVGTAIVILRTNPDLLRERLGPRRGAKTWDSVIVGLLGLLQLGRYIIAGLDQRYGWTGAWPLAAHAAALVVCALGYALFVWATSANAFFSQVVRIQTERGHTVATGGPYRYVRHPGYLGALAYEVAVPVLLGSWWAALPSAATVILLIIRTALEDRILLAELTGYAGYAARVRWRLLPGVW
jgi:protein-S-isoprenylcysteine O-methyltransferase Ste14